MIVRAFKHILQAVIAAVSKPEEMADAIAAALNLMLGVPESEQGVDSLTRSWLEVFLEKRYDWDLASFNYTELRKIAILRGLCHNVISNYPLVSIVYIVDLCWLNNTSYIIGSLLIFIT